MIACRHEEKQSGMNIIYLHHSTGGIIWKGSLPSIITRAAGKVSPQLAELVSPKPILPSLFDEYNKENNTNYNIKEMAFPKAAPYGWSNYPFDYYNIWVRNAGNEPYMEEPTLEMLTKQYQVIVFKHCFPVCNISEDQDTSDISSNLKTISNYKLQYEALRDKLHEFPNTKFILFTGAAQVKSAVSESEAIRAKEFFRWVINEWDLTDDNIYIWDLYYLQTEGGLYFIDEYAVSPVDSHPNKDFARRVARLLSNRIIDVIENNGNMTRITGEAK